MSTRIHPHCFSKNRWSATWFRSWLFKVLALPAIRDSFIGSNSFEKGLGTKLSVNSERRAFAEHRRDTENPEAVKSNGIVLTALLSIRTYDRTSGGAAPKPSG